MSTTMAAAQATTPSAPLLAAHQHPASTPEGPAPLHHPLLVAQALLAQQLTQLLALQDQEQLPWPLVASIMPLAHMGRHHQQQGQAGGDPVEVACPSLGHLAVQQMRTSGTHPHPLHPRASALAPQGPRTQTAQQQTAQQQERQRCTAVQHRQTGRRPCHLQPHSRVQEQSGQLHRQLQQGLQVIGWPREWCQRLRQQSLLPLALLLLGSRQRSCRRKLARQRWVVAAYLHLTGYPCCRVQQSERVHRLLAA